jgi:hypothetical protein
VLVSLLTNILAFLNSYFEHWFRDLWLSAFPWFVLQLRESRCSPATVHAAPTVRSLCDGELDSVTSKNRVIYVHPWYLVLLPLSRRVCHSTQDSLVQTRPRSKYFMGDEDPYHDFFRRGSQAVGPVSKCLRCIGEHYEYERNAS